MISIYKLVTNMLVFAFVLFIKLNSLIRNKSKLIFNSETYLAISLISMFIFVIIIIGATKVFGTSSKTFLEKISLKKISSLKFNVWNSRTVGAFFAAICVMLIHACIPYDYIPACFQHVNNGALH